MSSTSSSEEELTDNKRVALAVREYGEGRISKLIQMHNFLDLSPMRISLLFLSMEERPGSM